MELPTRIVFLDVDGPIAGFRQWITGDYYDISAVKLLAHLQREHHFLFVLSSSHRKLYQAAEAFISSVKEATGVELKFHEQWRTPSGVTLSDVTLPKDHGNIAKHYKERMGVEVDYDRLKKPNSHRGLEILKWLQDNNVHMRDILVLDDSRDIFPIPLKNFIYIKQGEIRGGLQIKHYDNINNYYKTNSRKLQAYQKRSEGEPTKSIHKTTG